MVTCSSYCCTAQLKIKRFKDPTGKVHTIEFHRLGDGSGWVTGASINVDDRSFAEQSNISSGRGYPASIPKKAGFTIDALKVGGYDAEELKLAEYSLESIKGAG